MDDEDVLALPLEQQWGHSKWNARKNAYTQVGELFAAHDEQAMREWAPRLKTAATDANVIALEAGIACVANYAKAAAPAAVDSLRDGLLGPMAEKACAAAKPSVKQVFQVCCQELCAGSANPPAIVEPLVPSTQTKSPKAVAAAVANLRALYATFGRVLPPKPALQILEKLFTQTDRNVRTETTQLALALCGVFGRAAVDAALAKAKPALLKELDPKFAAVETLKPARVPRILEEQAAEAEAEGGDGGADGTEPEEMEALDAYSLADPVAVKLPDISEPVSSAKWKERKEALESVLEALDGVVRIKPQDFSALVSQLTRVIAKDVNVMCYGAAISIVRLLALGLRGEFGYHQVLEPIVGRLKEKKATLIESIGECLEALVGCWGYPEVLGALGANLGNKIVPARIETSKVIVRLLSQIKDRPVDVLKEIGAQAVKNMTDSQEPVRAETARVLATLVKLLGPQMNSIIGKLDDLRKKKVEDAASSVEVAAKAGGAPKPKAVPRTASKAPAAAHPPKLSPSDRIKQSRPFESTDFTPVKQDEASRRRFSPARPAPKAASASSEGRRAASPLRGRESPLRAGRVSPAKSIVPSSPDYELQCEQLKRELNVSKLEYEALKTKFFSERELRDKAEAQVRQLKDEVARLKAEALNSPDTSFGLDQRISQVSLGTGSSNASNTSSSPPGDQPRPLSLALAPQRVTGVRRQAMLQRSSENWRRAMDVTNELKKRVEEMKRAREAA